MSGIVSFMLLGFVIREYYIGRKRKQLRLLGRDYRPPLSRVFLVARYAASAAIETLVLTPTLAAPRLCFGSCGSSSATESCIQ